MQIELPVVPDTTLIRKYGVAGSRYTSYPSALNFNDGVGNAAFEETVQTSNDELIPAPLSLYVHIPFCRSLCYYCGCNKRVTRNPAVVSGYLAVLATEIARKGVLFDTDRPVEQLHFGGGTPTYLDAMQRAGVMNALARHFDLSSGPSRDFSIEVDPRTVLAQELSQLAALGFNRVSFGVQDTNPGVQRAINRTHSVADLAILVAAARRYGLKTVSFDLIYGLPEQTPDSFEETLASVVALDPDSLSVFSYAHLPHLFPAQKMLAKQDLPDADSRLTMFATAIDFLQAEGYEYIGMDHFARPGSHLAKARDTHDLHRCFQGYASGGRCDTLGLGVSAISRIGDAYFQNDKDLRGYATAIEQGKYAVARGYQLTAEDRRIATVINELMCYGSIDTDAWNRTYEGYFQAFFADELQALEALSADGLVVVDGQRISVTATGRLFLRNIARCFDRQACAQAGHYSSTV
ncbi:MAG: oxygen-independent coproporphyrinogen III oxidase [Pseudomonadota bacterium]